MKGFWIVGFLFIFFLDMKAQDTLSYEEKYRMEYEKRIQKSHIDGVYIPEDLEDAHRILDEIIEESGKVKFASQDEEFAVKNVFFSFGRWILINWGLEQGSRLSASINKMGLNYPDDMVLLIMFTYHRKLNNRPLETGELVNSIPGVRLKKESEMANSHPGNQ